MFSGLRSRWTMFLACAAASELAIWRHSSSASYGGELPIRASRRSSGSPSRYSMTMNALPSVW